MKPTHVIDADLAEVFGKPDRSGYRFTLAWGDPVEAVAVTPKHVELRLAGEAAAGSSGYIVPRKTSKLKPADVVRPLAKNKVLKADFVDVQQGDGTVLETPSGQVMLIDGGDNQMFARYLAAKYPGTSLQNPKDVACILVSHGDADHFQGLTKIHESERHETRSKNLYLRPARVYHNGLVKRPSSVLETERLGPTVKSGKDLLITGLVDDLRSVPDADMNEPFRAWKAALLAWDGRASIQAVKRIAQGDKTAFQFLKAEGIQVDVLGPIEVKAGGKPALPFLGNPQHGPRSEEASLSQGMEGFTGKSASHTINGHSVVLRLSYGNVRFLFGGDLNDQASRLLAAARPELLQAEVLKVPHHGSGDFSGAFLKAVEPLVSVVSSGDESAQKEYIHPRATLMGALGKHGRGSEPLIFVTELIAFFEKVGDALPAGPVNGAAKRFFAFQRTNYGLARVRTDGKRILVCTNSGLKRLKEAYAYEVDEQHQAKAVDLRLA